jgi:hypothetical protein
MRFGDVTIAHILVIASIFALALALAGCSAGNAGSNPSPASGDLADGSGQQARQFPVGQGRAMNGTLGDRRGGDRMANLTEEQRQELMKQREQESMAACQGKAVDDTCTVPSFGGTAGNVSGTCALRNETLTCGFRGPPRGQAPR